MRVEERAPSTSAFEINFFVMTDFATAPGASTFLFPLPPWGPGPWLIGQPAKTVPGPFPEELPALPTLLTPTLAWAHSPVRLKGR